MTEGFDKYYETDGGVIILGVWEKDGNREMC